MARLVKPLLLMVMIAFIAAAGYISALVIERQEALEKVSRYNVAWLVGQAATEYARLEQRVSAFGTGGVDADEVQLRFDIIVNRKNLLETGDVNDFVVSDPDHRATVEQLEQMIQSAQPLVDRIDEPGKAQQLSKMLAALDTRLLRLAAAANRWGGDRVAEDQRQLVLLHWQFSAVAAGLILCGLVLMTGLFWNNRLVKRAHIELHGLADQLGTQNERFNAALTNLEITETVFLADNDLTLSILHDLRGFGVRIAMDDFGTGYSSLSYLRSFPFDKIKLDRSFVRDLGVKPDSFAIVQSIAALGTSLGMTTIAEGIETSEQLEQVKAAGFAEGQGYLFGRPQPVERLVTVAENITIVQAA